jgi:hypothetical protein
MITYVRNNIEGFYAEFPQEIDAAYWQGKIGTTYEDFLANKWVLLSKKQVQFHNLHPNASIKEVLDMEITPTPPRTLADAKAEKIAQIEAYDSSDSVNGFTISISGGESMTAWITPDQRSNYKNSLDSAELLGLEEVHPVFNGIQLTLATSTAKMALAQIQIYADRCYIVTETHKAAVEALESIEDVDAYTYETGYPERLVFNL